ncbi:uncharacterized protein LOC130338802 isoform X2 [Hyla sarda]|nr:uncharacterized protein LOC130338802 isoform X2 [Hyla sarda]
MMEDHRPLTSQDGVIDRNPPERCPRPLCSQDCPEGNVPENHQVEDQINIEVEVKDEPEEETDFWADQQSTREVKEEIPGGVSPVGIIDRNPPERCPRPLYSLDCPEGNFPQNYQVENQFNIKVKDEAEEETDFGADQQYGVIDRNPPERCPRPLYSQDCPEGNVPENDLEQQQLLPQPTPAEWQQQHQEQQHQKRQRRRRRQLATPQLEQLQQPAPMQQPHGRGLRRGHHGRRGGSGSNKGRTEPFEKIVIDNDLLIQMVHDRPALWDQTDPQHANHTATRRLWEDIYSAIVERGKYVWDELEDWQRISFGEQIKCRWNSFRDRFIRDAGAEAKTPGGSGAVQKRAYIYKEQLSFLQKCSEMKKTSSSVQAGPSSSESGQLASGTREQVASQSDHSFLPETSSGGPSCRAISAGCGSVVQQMRSDRRRRNDLEDLISVLQDALIRLDQQMHELRDEVTRLVQQQEGAGRSASPPSPSHLFLNSLVIPMEQLPIERQFEFRQCIINKMMELLTHPPS